ncbi:MAG TPA: deoxyribodipyrimidine photo-lyase [Thermodesulfobacteriota bacterium]|nr:deoxyribodipyrimidine photo-lyase [Thermodesulfobacteriota bacterium]
MIYGKAVFWFKRDLRTDDNTGLLNAVRDSREIIPLYVLEDSLLSKYSPGSKRLGFFADALVNLDSELRRLGSYLLVLKGKAEEIIPALISSQRVEAVYTNRAYGFSGVKRDLGIEHQCRLHDVAFRKYDDTFLVPPQEIDQRKVFTPFYNIWLGKRKNPAMDAPVKISSPALTVSPVEGIVRDLGGAPNKYWPIDFAARRLRDFNFEDYGMTRDYPYLDGTSRLSPYLRFGIVSVRRVYEAAAKASPEPGPYISELAWREFWYHIMHNFPETRGLEFQEKRRNIKWINSESWYDAWREGRTGYPIVDAGMRQLREEGWMHNRVRMIVASFLTKDLITDWRLGDRHFFEHLVDYDETVDIGNWQWSASCGADPKPFRIFNPILQSQSYDPECLYIKKYIPDLSLVEPEKIHNPLTYKLPYMRPIVNHYEMRNLAHEAYSGGRIDDLYISQIKKDTGLPT